MYIIVYYSICMSNRNNYNFDKNNSIYSINTNLFNKQYLLKLCVKINNKKDLKIFINTLITKHVSILISTNINQILDEKLDKSSCDYILNLLYNNVNNDVYNNVKFVLNYFIENNYTHLNVDNLSDSNINKMLQNKNIEGAIIGRIKGSLNCNFNGHIWGKTNIDVFGDVEGLLEGNYIKLTGNVKLNGFFIGFISGSILGDINAEVNCYLYGIFEGDIIGTASLDLNCVVNGSVRCNFKNYINSNIYGYFNTRVSTYTNSKLDGFLDCNISGKLNGELNGTIEGHLNYKISNDKNNNDINDIDTNSSNKVNNNKDNKFNYYKNDYININVISSIHAKFKGISSINTVSNVTGKVDCFIKGNLRGLIEGDIDCKIDGYISGSLLGYISLNIKSNKTNLFISKSSCENIDFYLSSLILETIKKSYKEIDIKKSLYNFNKSTYKIINNNIDVVNDIFNIIINNFHIIFSGEYSTYKTILSYLLLISIIESMSKFNNDSFNPKYLDVNGIGFDNFNFSQKIENYTIQNKIIEVFYKFNIVFILEGIEINESNWKKSSFFCLEILNVHKFVEKTYKYSKGKTTVFFKLINFNVIYYNDLNISLNPITSFYINDVLYKIDFCIYSVVDCVSYNKFKINAPIIDPTATLSSDFIGYTINKEYLNIAIKLTDTYFNSIGLDKKLIENGWYIKINNKNLKLKLQEFKDKYNKQLDDEIDNLLTTSDNSFNNDIKKNTKSSNFLENVNNNNTTIKKKHKKKKNTNVKLVNTDLNELVEEEKNKLKHEIGYISRKISSHLDYYNTLKLLNQLSKLEDNLVIYFSTYYDFRSRLYMHGIYNPISNKIFRNVIDYNLEADLNNFNSDESTLVLNLIKSKYLKELNKLDLKNNSDLFKVSLFWLFIALGQNFKSDNIKESRVLIIDLLNLGIDTYKFNQEKLKQLELDEQLECLKYISIIDNLIIGKFNSKCFICKDSTASVLQHLHIYLGYKNIDALKSTNIIGSDYWYDPYSIIIDTFLNGTDIDTDFCIKYFTRKTLKKSIMTHSYSVSRYRSYCYFLNGLDKILKKENKKFWSLDLEEQKKFSKNFNSFYNFLDNDFETKLFYSKKSKDLIEFVSGISFLDGTVINLTYNELKYRRREIKSSQFNIRVSYDSQIKSNYVNIETTNNALRANIIHASDAYLNRSFIKKYSSLSIHDCFCLHLVNINSCIHFINKFFYTQINNTNKNLLIKNYVDVCVYIKEEDIFVLKKLNYFVTRDVYNNLITLDNNSYNIEEISLTIIL